MAPFFLPKFLIPQSDFALKFLALICAEAYCTQPFNMEVVWMAERVETAAVLGAGVMGSAIAAHLVGAGIRTILLDIVPPNLNDEEKKDRTSRNRFADGGLAKALKIKPAAFYEPDAARLMTTGNLDDDLERLKECDLIIEAVIERMAIKQSLFAKIVPHLKSTAIQINFCLIKKSFLK